MINCPRCEQPTRVQETRATGVYVRRRRICVSARCGAKITTIELVVANDDLKSPALADPIVLPRRAIEGALGILVEALAGRIGRQAAIKRLAGMVKDASTQPTEPTDHGDKNGETV